MEHFYLLELLIHIFGTHKLKGIVSRGETGEMINLMQKLTFFLQLSQVRFLFLMNVFLSQCF
jgi:hypothetical protein